MKKMLAFLLVGFSVLALSACSSEEADGLKIVFPDEDGKKTIELYDTFNVLQGVTAIDEEGNNWGSKLEVSIDDANKNLLEGSTFSGLEAGSYELNYSLDFMGNTGKATRTVVVNEGAETGDNLLTNSTFDADLTGWEVLNEGGAVFTPQSNGSILVENDTCPGQAYQVRLNTHSFAVEAGKTYEVTFDASSTNARNILVQVGQTLEADPWYYQAAPDIEVALTTTLSRKSVKFTASKTNDNMDLSDVCLLIGMGAVGSAINSDITIANVSIHTYGGAVADTVNPLVTQTVKTVYSDDLKTTYTKDEIINDFYTISDDVTDFDDLDISLTITNPSGVSAETLDATVKGDWRLSLSVKDEAGNSAISPTVAVTARDKVSIDNYLTIKTDGFAPSGSDEITSQTNPNLGVFWSEGGSINQQSGSTITETSLTIEYAVAWAWYDPQFFLTTQVIDYTGTYIVSLDVTNVTTNTGATGYSSRDITVAGEQITVANGVKQTVEVEVEIVAGDSFTLCILFNWLDAGVSTDTSSNPDGTVKELLKIENMSMVKKA